MTSTAPIIDCECHAYAPSVETIFALIDDSLAARLRETAFRLPNPSPHPGVEVLASDVAAAVDPVAVAASLPDSVHRVLLVPAQIFPAAGWLDHGLVAAFAGALNEHFVETWLPVDERFQLAAALSSHDADAAAAELVRWQGNPRVVAGCLSLTGVNMGHKHYHPLYEAAAAQQMPLMIHPSGVEGNALGAPTLGGTIPRTAQETFSLLPQVAAANLASLIYDGIFVRYPQLKVIFAGVGFEWMLPLIWRLDQEWRNLRADVPWLTHPPSQDIADHVRLVVDAACVDVDEQSWTLIDLLPPELLLYGSDAPFDDRGSSRTVDALRAGNGRDARGRAILADNAIATFGV